MKLNRAILAGLSDLFAATLVLSPFIETSVNKNPMLTLIAIVRSTVGALQILKCRQERAKGFGSRATESYI